jgi:hypothetical protein
MIRRKIPQAHCATAGLEAIERLPPLHYRHIDLSLFRPAIVVVDQVEGRHRLARPKRPDVRLQMMPMELAPPATARHAISVSGIAGSGPACSRQGHQPACPPRGGMARHCDRAAPGRAQLLLKLRYAGNRRLRQPQAVSSGLETALLETR